MAGIKETKPLILVLVVAAHNLAKNAFTRWAVEAVEY
jgi:hypothetical protein